ncbi:MAG: HAD family hydrolase [Planctomycetota bacterium]|nr:HAD family hydrolase [Planctomycetota bacterium]
MKYQAVLFDLDGTLLDTIDDLADAMNTALLANGLPPRPDVEQHKYFVGDGVRNYVLRAMPEDKRADENLISRVTVDYRAAFAAGWRNKTRPYDGIGELLNSLAARGLAMAVLSNKPDDATRAAVAHFLADAPFEIVRGAIDGEPIKPDPATTLEIAEQMGFKPAEFLYLGDTNTDMQTAVAAGIHPVGALWGFRPAEELTQNGAKILIKHPTELLKLI